MYLPYKYVIKIEKVKNGDGKWVDPRAYPHYDSLPQIAFCVGNLMGDCSSYSVGSICCNTGMYEDLFKFPAHFLSLLKGSYGAHSGNTNKFIFSHNREYFQESRGGNKALVYKHFKQLASKETINKVKGWTGSASFEIRILETAKNFSTHKELDIDWDRYKLSIEVRECDNSVASNNNDYLRFLQATESYTKIIW